MDRRNTSFRYQHRIKAVSYGLYNRNVNGHDTNATISPISARSAPCLGSLSAASVRRFRPADNLSFCLWCITLNALRSQINLLSVPFINASSSRAAPDCHSHARLGRCVRAELSRSEPNAARHSLTRHRADHPRLRRFRRRERGDVRTNGCGFRLSLSRVSDFISTSIYSFALRARSFLRSHFGSLAFIHRFNVSTLPAPGPRTHTRPALSVSVCLRWCLVSARFNATSLTCFNDAALGRGQSQRQCLYKNTALRTMHKIIACAHMSRTTLVRHLWEIYRFVCVSLLFPVSGGTQKRFRSISLSIDTTYGTVPALFSRSAGSVCVSASPLSTCRRQNDPVRT